MTRKEFELIAAALRDARPPRALRDAAHAASIVAAGKAIDDVARELATRLAATNPRFNRARFLDACGVTS